MSKTSDIHLIFNEMCIIELYAMNIFGTEFIIEDGHITGVIQDNGKRES